MLIHITVITLYLSIAWARFPDGRLCLSKKNNIRLKMIDDSVHPKV